MPGQEVPKVDMWNFLSIDKLVHVILFAVLVLLMIVGLTKQSKYQIVRLFPVYFSLAISIAYAIFTELIQWFIPERQVELQDLIANTVGCLTGVGIFYLIYKI